MDAGFKMGGAPEPLQTYADMACRQTRARLLRRKGIMIMAPSFVTRLIPKNDFSTICGTIMARLTSRSEERFLNNLWQDETLRHLYILTNKPARALILHATQAWPLTPIFCAAPARDNRRAPHVFHLGTLLLYVTAHSFRLPSKSHDITWAS